MSERKEQANKLKLETVIGFNAHVLSGLKEHPDSEHLIYSVGSTVILKSMKSGEHALLHGHTKNVSCLSLSKSGKYIATGQINAMGFKATVIIWDFAKRTIYANLTRHIGKVEALTFSPNDKYLVSLGGQDDASIVIWDIATKQAICGSPASSRCSSFCFAVKYSNTNDDIFVSAGSETLRVWQLDLPNRKIRPTNCNTGKLRRIMKCIEIPENDQFIYCGTTSGDVLKINMNTKLLNDCGPVKSKYNAGVNVIKMLKSGHLLLGSGSGTVALSTSTNFKILLKVELGRGVTSIALQGDNQKFFVGTAAAQIHSIRFKDFKSELMSSGHNSAVHAVAMPVGTSELFATCSHEEIRLWCIDKSTERLRITVPNVTCNAVDFMFDGHSIISAWNDGAIRIFGPETGRVMHVIHGAHRLGATAIAGTRNCKMIISGGGDGQVHAWALKNGCPLLEIMKAHKGVVLCIKIKSDDKQCISASVDGSCVIWDLVRFTSIQMLNAITEFKGVCYYPEEYHIITCGSDRKVVYWDVFDGSIIREVMGSECGHLNSMHISGDGRHFVTGGEDGLVKLWDYTKGTVTHVGSGHGGSITSVIICSNSRTIISTSEDGAILRWRFPDDS